MILLVTDFEEFYLAQMKGVIWRKNPDVSILDLTVERHDILSGAFTIDRVVDYFPGSIIVGVIDPGVGGSRKNIVVETKKHYFIGPDNGLFSLVCRRYSLRRIVEIEKEDISYTFHGRDVYAPLAADISLRKDIHGKQLEKLTDLGVPDPRIEKDQILCTVLFVDNFGNIITNVPKEDVPTINKIRFRGVTIPFLRIYSETENFLALIGSHGFLEIAGNKKNAANSFNVIPGDTIRLSLD